MTDNRLPSTSAAPRRQVKYGKLAAAVCAAIVVVAIIGLVVIRLPIVMVKVISSYQQLTMLRSMLIGLGAAAVGLMLMAVAIADITPHKRARRFAVGFLGWPMLNVIVGAVAFVISYSMTANCRAQSSCGFGEGFGILLIFIVMGLIANIGILIFLAITRRWWIMTGTVTSFVVAGAIYVYLYGWHFKNETPQFILARFVSQLV